jgi:ABC-type multidrug transport system ATPase subunit
LNRKDFDPVSRHAVILRKDGAAQLTFVVTAPLLGASLLPGSRGKHCKYVLEIFAPVERVKSAVAAYLSSGRKKATRLVLPSFGTADAVVDIPEGQSAFEIPEDEAAGAKGEGWGDWMTPGEEGDEDVAREMEADVSEEDEGRERIDGGLGAKQRQLVPVSTGPAIEVAPLDPPALPLFVQFRDIVYSVPGKKKRFHRKKPPRRTLLHGVSGSVAPGEFLAIMGPTGCGKTTLLNVLSLRVTKGVEGQLLYNGRPARLKELKRHIAYVLQDDVLFPNLTVWKTLLLTARLRLPRELTYEEKVQKTQQVIDVLNLNKTKSTIIGGPFRRGVSGGERKRVNIGNQLLTSPSVIFLDEPTSGLDTSTAYNLVRVLRSLAMTGYTIISTIHQPSSMMYELFDKLLLLVDGYAIYYGDAQRAVEYFANMGLNSPPNYNPADFMMGMILEEELQRGEGRIKKQLIEAWKAHGPHPYGTSPEQHKAWEEKELAECKKKEAQYHRPKYEANWFLQFWVLAQRSWTGAIASYLQPLPIIQMLVVAVVVGLVWLWEPLTEDTIRDRTGALFFIGLFAGGFTPVLNALYNFPPERAIIARERAEGSYRLSAYFIAKNLSELPWDLLYPLIFVCISYWMVGLRTEFTRFLLFVAVVLASNLAASGLGLMISAIVQDLKAATVLATIILLLMLLTAGFYIPINRIHVWLSWLRYISFLKYTYDGLVTNEFMGRGVIPGPSGLTGQDVLDTQFIIVQLVGVNIAILIGFALLFRVSAFFLLKLSFWRLRQ